MIPRKSLALLCIPKKMGTKICKSLRRAAAGYKPEEIFIIRPIAERWRDEGWRETQEKITRGAQKPKP